MRVDQIARSLDVAPDDPSEKPEAQRHDDRQAAWLRLRECSSLVRGRGETLSTAVSPSLRGTRLLAAVRGAATRRAYRAGATVAGVSLLVPPEICWAAGFVPFNWEMFASLLSTNAAIASLADAGSEENPRCSFLNALKGARRAGILPRPDVAVSSSAYCAGIGYLFEELAERFSVVHLHLDLPARPTSEAVVYVTDQLAAIHGELARLAGLDERVAVARLREALRLSMAARRAYGEMREIRRAHPELDFSLEPLLWHFLFAAFWGSEEGVRICEQLRDDVAERAAAPPSGNAGPAIGVFSLVPYGRTEVWQRLVAAGARCVFEGINWLGPVGVLDDRDVETLPARSLYRRLAMDILSSPMRGGRVHCQADTFMAEVRSFGARGLLVFSHDQCQMTGPRLAAVESAARRAGLEVCVVNGDCLLGIPTGAAGFRLDSFLSRVAGRRSDASTVRAAGPGASSPAPYRYRVGVDLGSGFSKFVVLEGELTVIRHGVLESGIDYPALLRRILGELPAEGSRALAVAGVGGDNPGLGGLADLQTTEMMALDLAIRRLLPSGTPLIVVDVGSQDIKVLKFSGGPEPAWSNTNKSCGAGTGFVLSQILERWQTTEPEMTFERLDELAMGAAGVEPISSTCGIFAITHVVSALTRADEPRRQAILRGIYKYIAAQVIRHIPAAERGTADLVLVGGLATHRSLRRALEEEGLSVIALPGAVPPQHVVALGAALSVGGA